MKSIRCIKPGNLIIEEITEPHLSDACALLRINCVGICGTDLHAFRGNQPFFSYPRILGHELAAEVIDVATNHDRIKIGDKVVVVPYINCEKCGACRAGKSNCCQSLRVFGVHTDGGMQEIISLPTRLLIPANDLSFEEIAIVEPLAIGAHALRRAQTKKDDIIVVTGCGPIGIGIIQLGKYIGATVIAVDINDYRLKVAKENFGADFIVNALQSPADKIKEFTNGDLAHCVFDASGNKHAIEGGTAYIRHGGSFVLVGLFKGELSFQHPQIHAKETTLMCSRNATSEDFKFVMRVLRERKFNTDAYITKKVDFKTIITEFDSWASLESKEIKVVTVWN